MLIHWKSFKAICLWAYEVIIQPLALSKNQKLRSLTLRGLDRQGSPFWSLPSTQKQWTSHPCRERAACSKHFFSKVSTKFCQLFRRGESFERLKRLDTNKATIKKKQTNKQNKETASPSFWSFHKNALGENTSSTSFTLMLPKVTTNLSVAWAVRISGRPSDLGLSL